ncbi:MAG: exopolysaccharide biosynthesis protein [Rickettsiales bacterium]|nr:exopolysaccharide biosynthesis protein [Rickettsiales bacterium]
MKRSKTISTQGIEDVVNQSSADKIPIADLVRAMEAAGYGLVMIIFSLATIMPLPPPIPNIFSIPIVIFAVQMILGYDAPKLPPRIGNIMVKRSIVSLLVQKTARYIGKIEKVLRQRLTFVVSPIFERILGFIIMIFSLFVMIPLPFTNFIPGTGIMLISFGLLGKDGLFVIIGSLVGIIGVVISIITIFIGVEVFNTIKDLFM